MMFWRVSFCLFIFSQAALLSGPASAKESFKVIVNKSNSISKLDRKRLSDIFLKKIKIWNGGETIQPVVLSYTFPIRQEFSLKVLGRSLSATRNYWQQMIFSGREVHPMVMSSESEIVEYVSKNKNAISYVSSQADTSQVKVIQVDL